ncbi:MAG: peptidylprolyl isomerase, partial [Verrucomicrobiales bacterium]|nr:peptidylprolyl isomerase [Verrucomicrobiales bacterium]
MRAVLRLLRNLLPSLLVGAALASPGADSPVLASGKGIEVTQTELDEAFINLRGAMAAQGRPFAEQQRALFEKQLLEKLALTEILMSKATDSDKAKAKEKVGKILAEERARAKSDARFEAQVRAAGLSPASFEAQLLERATCEEVMDRELRPQLGVTPEKVREFYDKNAAEFRQPERLRLLQIVLSFRGPGGGPLGETEKAEKKTIAAQLVERARKGDDFVGLVKQYSDDPAGRDRGGEYIFPVGKMVPEFEVAVLGLTTNQVSDVITTPYAFHVVKVLERLPG